MNHSCSNSLPFPRDQSFPRCHKGGKHILLTKRRSNQSSKWEMACLEFLWLILTYTLSYCNNPSILIMDYSLVPRKGACRERCLWPKTDKMCLTNKIAIPSEKWPLSPVRSSRFNSKMKKDPLYTRIKSSSYDPEYITYEYAQGSKDKDMPLFKCVCINM